MSNDLTLYELSGQYAVALRTLSDLELDEQAVADTLEGLRGTLEAKATNVAMFAKNMEALANQIGEAMDHMAQRRKALENRAARLRAYIKQHLDAVGITQISSPHFAVSVKRNPPMVIIDEPEQIPDEYMVKPLPPPPYPDKRLIAEALKRGEAVPGAHLDQRTRLDIR